MKNNIHLRYRKPAKAFIIVSWAALFLGIVSYIFGLWNTSMQLNEKGYFFTVMMYGLFAAISLQKTVRDRVEGIPVSHIYFNLCWASVMIAIFLLSIGLWNATLQFNEKGFYAISFFLSLFAVITVQKNTRDINEAIQQDSSDREVDES